MEKERTEIIEINKKETRRKTGKRKEKRSGSFSLYIYVVRKPDYTYLQFYFQVEKKDREKERKIETRMNLGNLERNKLELVLERILIEKGKGN